MAQQYDREPEKDLATRTGALAMLIHSIGTSHSHNLAIFKLIFDLILLSRRCGWDSPPLLGSARCSPARP